jgi:hypothetical protein
MMRGLSNWRLPILTVADRGGSRLSRRRPNRKNATVKRAMRPLVPDGAVLCPNGGNGYRNLAAARQLERFVVGSKNLNGYIRWLAMRLAEIRPVELVRASQIWWRGKGPLRALAACLPAIGSGTSTVPSGPW